MIHTHTHISYLKKIELLDHTKVLVIDELANLSIKDQKEENKRKGRKGKEKKRK